MGNPKMVTPYLITEPLTSTRHYGRYSYSTVAPQRALYPVGAWPLHIGAVLDFLGFFYREFLKKIKYFFKTSQLLSKNYGGVWAPVLENSRSYSVLKFIFFGEFWGFLFILGVFPVNFALS